MSGIPIVSTKMPNPNRENHPDSIRPERLRLRHGLFFGLVGATALTGVSMMFDIIRSGGVNALEVVVLVLFTVTFSWISIPFWNAVIGFMLMALRRDPLSLGQSIVPRLAGPIASRTALIMPAYNEDPERIMGGLRAVLRSLAETPHTEQFDLYLLSDTTDPVRARAEEAAWTTLEQELDRLTGLFYRRREANIGRKAGNIAEFCRRWGAQYDFMVVLDADSVMTGSTLVELVHRMEANPGIGLIQTVPIPARRDTLFGRLVQFAASVYSPMLATGQSFWQTDAANYWGHNAIVRIEPFVEHCSLPVIGGTPPLGGPVLSHDFVEAAWMRRAGWGVYLLPSIGGSYEEVPANILDYAKRDRRWTQGSLQHLRLLTTGGLHPLSRLHFLLGALGYVASLLWLLMLLASTAYIAMLSAGIEAFPGGYLLFPDQPGGWIAPGEWVPLLGVTIALLFVPKLLGVILALFGNRRSFGGTGRLLLSAGLEMLFAVVIAPVMMIYHSRFVLSVLGGHDKGWEPPVRQARSVGWAQAWRSARGTTAVGLGWAGLTLYCSPTFFLWLTPIFTGLLLSVPLVRATSSRSVGRWTRRWGLFLVPSETAAPPELQASTEGIVRLSGQPAA